MKKCIIALMLGFILTVSLCIYSDAMQEKVAQNVLRLHILANSDSALDQALKLKIRDRLLTESRTVFASCDSLAQSRSSFLREKENLQKAAEDEIRKSGFDYPVTLSLEKVHFPTKYYDGIALPSGEYEAVRVLIGEGNGQNWWCVMFPPLCFVDGSIEGAGVKALTDIAGEHAPILTPNASQNVEIRFKVVDFFQNATHIIKTAFNRA